MSSIDTLASKGLHEPKSLTPDEIKTLASHIAKEAHVSATVSAAAKKGVDHSSTLTEAEIKELAAHVLGEKAHTHQKK